MEIVYQDDYILVINKSTGIVSDPNKIPFDSFLPRQELPYHAVNRIDQVVSGLLMISKTSESAALFSSLYKNKLIEKTYLAIVEKGRAKSSEKLEKKLIRNAKVKKAFVNEKGKKASLTYKKIGATEHYDCLEVTIKEGRFHMIRCLLSDAGMPIKGDVKYGARRKNKDRSIDLHAHKLSFVHPATKESHNIIAPLRDNNLWRACEVFL